MEYQHVSCCVPLCGRIPKGVPVLRFPDPKKEITRFKKWINLCGNEHLKNRKPEDVHKHFRICGRHFPENILINHRLKKDILPSLGLPTAVASNNDCDLNLIDCPNNYETSTTIELDFYQDLQEVPSTSGLHTFERKRSGTLDHDSDRNVKVARIVAKTPTIVANDPCEEREHDVTDDFDKEDDVDILEKDEAPHERQIIALQSNELKNEVKRLKRKVRGLEKKILTSKKLVKETSKILKENRKLEEMLNNMTPFQQTLLKCQFRNYGKKKYGRTFTDEEKINCIIMWKTSPKLYRLLYKLLCLPSVSTLQQVLSAVSIEPGINDTIFHALEKKIENFEHRDKLCTLIFDEMAIQPHLDYNKHQDYVVGLEDDGSQRTEKIADHVMVFMLRGIFKRWKQPVAFSFCKDSMSADKIVSFYKDIVVRAEAIGLKVIASICDQGTTNVRAINTLLKKSKEENPDIEEEVIVINKKIHVIHIYDPPHLLKSIRNNLLDKDLKFSMCSKSQVAKWDHIWSAYNICKSHNIGLLKGITEHHVNPSKVKKMKVSNCVKVFSSSTAAAIKCCALFNANSKNGDYALNDEALDTVTIIKFFDKLFDSMNGGMNSPRKEKKSRQMYTSDSYHKEFWMRAKHIFKSMEFIPKKANQRKRPPVLTGWITTINGFLQIASTLQNLGYDKFPTRAFNQDPIENFFGQLRQYGGRNNNPTCVAFVPYFKSLLIKNFSKNISSSSNCEHDSDEVLLTLNHFLKPNKNLIKKRQPDIWRYSEIPDVDTFETLTINEVQTNISHVETTAIGYVAGAILNSIEVPECESCCANLLHQGEATDIHHKYNLLKEYTDTKKSLCYANTDLINNLIITYYILNKIIESVFYKNNLQNRITQVLKLWVNFKFKKCPHSETISDSIITKFTELFLFTYTKKLVNIMNGKLQLPDDSLNKLERAAKCTKNIYSMRKKKN